MKIIVLPFDLKPSILEYAIYYRGKLLFGQSVKKPNSEWKTQEQYKSELLDMLRHGTLYPTLYQPYDGMLGAALKTRKELGFPSDKLYVLGTTTGNPNTNAQLEALDARIRRWKAIITEYGYKSLYIYGIDEASNQTLLSERDAWKMVHSAGARIFVACYATASTVALDLLDRPILSGNYKPEVVQTWHRESKPVLIYDNPQVGIEDPDLYRRNYGVRLWYAGYDGAMVYAYQHGFGDIWNDFDNVKYRDHVFAYPTSSKVIDTVEWEGFRAGIDDVRYLSTLLSCDNKSDVYQNISKLLKNGVSSYEIRHEMIRMIMRKRSAVSVIN